MALRLEARKARMRALRSSAGTSISSVSLARLKGSVSSVRRWRAMVGRSMTVPEVGMVTGSSMISNVIGSRNSSGMSPSSASASTSSCFALSHRDRNASSASSCCGAIVGAAPRARTRTALRMLSGLYERVSLTTAAVNSACCAKRVRTVQILSSSVFGWKLYFSGSRTLSSAHVGPTSCFRKWLSMLAMRGHSSGSRKVRHTSGSVER
mmetsp:Transcript_23028/g.67905  ORF Transcript_23028/g.67905 Transcript_23028/m.67905 type:complete len:209 (+) Transcript_23028:308-934(+)